MNRQLVYLIVGVPMLFVFDFSLRSGNLVLVYVSMMVISACAVLAIMYEPTHKAIKKASKPELSESILVTLSKKEKELIALALFSIYAHVPDKVTLEVAYHIAIKLGIKKELVSYIRDAEIERYKKGTNFPDQN